MQVEYYLITDGTLNDVAKAIVIERSDEVEEAMDRFAEQTGTPCDSIVVNPVGPRCC